MGSEMCIRDRLRAHTEGAVRAARPSWAAQDFIGQEVGAFADFLIWGVQATPRLRARAIAVYHAQDGGCEIFRSAHHVGRQSPVIALWFASPGEGQVGHYYWLRFGNPDITLRQLLAAHRRGAGPGSRVHTIVTNAVG